MPKNKGKGGKNRRRGKNENESEKRELIFKEDEQEYAQVTKMLGNGRLEAMCFDGVKRLCHIRGKLRKKVSVTRLGHFVIGINRKISTRSLVILSKMKPQTYLRACSCVYVFGWGILRKAKAVQMEKPRKKSNRIWSNNYQLFVYWYVWLTRFRYSIRIFKIKRPFLLLIWFDSKRSLK